MQKWRGDVNQKLVLHSTPLKKFFCICDLTLSRIVIYIETTKENMHETSGALLGAQLRIQVWYVQETAVSNCLCLYGKYPWHRGYPAAGVYKMIERWERISFWRRWKALAHPNHHQPVQRRKEKLLSALAPVMHMCTNKKVLDRKELLLYNCINWMIQQYSHTINLDQICKG